MFYIVKYTPKAGGGRQVDYGKIARRKAESRLLWQSQSQPTVPQHQHFNGRGCYILIG